MDKETKYIDWVLSLIGIKSKLNIIKTLVLAKVSHSEWSIRKKNSMEQYLSKLGGDFQNRDYTLETDCYNQIRYAITHSK